MNTAYTPPSIKENMFSCPYCHGLAHQKWFAVCAQALPSEMALPFTADRHIEWIENKLKSASHEIERKILEKASADALGRKVKARSGKALFFAALSDRQTTLQSSTLSEMWGSKCEACQAVALWLGDSLIHPRICTAPPASPDLPEDIRVDVEEARKVLNDSPRASAALLRLALEKLCNQLTGKPELKLAKKIGLLAKDGLPERTQQAMDAIRVISNNAVHPGKMDLQDNRDIALRLFDVVDTIVHDTFTRTKQIQKISAFLPATQKNTIARSDQAPS